jgi:hypothetical protein
MQMGQHLQAKMFRGIYKGVLSPLAGTVPCWAAFYFGYNLGKQILPQPKPEDNPSEAYSTLLSFASGCVAGTLLSTVKCPVDALKIVAQNERVSVLQAARMVGLRGLGRGAFATVIAIVPSTGVFAAVLDFSKRRLPKDAPWAPVVAGGLAGIDSHLAL